MLTMILIFHEGYIAVKEFTGSSDHPIRTMTTIWAGPIFCPLCTGSMPPQEARMAEYDTFIALAATYGSVDTAKGDYEALKSLYYDLGLIDTFDAAVLEKTADGKVKIVAKHEQPTRHGAWLGAGVGLATGLAVALFPAVAVGAGIAYGTGIGAGLGALAGHTAGGMSRGDLKDLGETLDDGQAALVAVAAADLSSKIEAAFARAEKVTQKQLKSDKKALEKDLAEAEKQSEASA
jgi:uncharacterized membrane protein